MNARNILRSALSLPLMALIAMGTAAASSPRSFELLSAAAALTPDPGRGEVLYIKHCASCHNPRAGGNGPREVPALAGQREFYLLEQLVWFAALDRMAPEMHRIVARPELDNPQALRDVAGYLARKGRSTRTDHGDGRALEAGKRIYTQACAMCHGENGQGSDDEPIPAIGGQHYFYVLAQLEGFAAGHRSDAGPPVIDFTAGLSPQEKRGVSDYVSRLTALTAQ